MLTPRHTRGPLAPSDIRIEGESLLAGQLGGDAVDAAVEFRAKLGILVSVVTIGPGTLGRGLGFLCDQ